jgi:hypothetical protein
MLIDKDILRWVLLIGATPIWLPFLRALWRDFNGALREEGGLMGSPPSPRELEAIRNERKSEPENLLSEPWVQPGDRRTTRMRAPAARPAGGERAPRKSGFGSTNPPGGR